jgi:phosphoribosylformylglycinamidine cyclo-ligase
MSSGLAHRGESVGPGTDEGLAAELLRHLRSTYGPAVVESYPGSAASYSLPGEVGLFARRCTNPVLVARAAGVGPKLQLAQMLGKHDGVGTDLVARCVNELLVEGALPLFFLSHLAAGDIEMGRALEVVRGIAEGCRQADCALLASETSRLPGSHEPGRFELTGFAVGMVERARRLDGRARTCPGDVVLGLASTGLHASGFPLVRKLFFDAQRMRAEQAIPELGGTLGEELLRPSRIYVRSVRAALERYRVKGVVHALACIGDGGLLGDLPRVLGRRCVARIERSAWPRPPIFGLVQGLGNLDDAEMFRVFNMGIGMVAVVAPFYADAAARRMAREGDRVSVIGEIVQGDGPAVELV